MKRTSPPPITVERHPPERGPQSVVLPSACCTCCCCCSCCCLTTVGAVIGGVIALKGSDDEARVRARKRVNLLLWLAVVPTIIADLAFSLPLVVTAVTLPLSMLGAGFLAWLLYVVGVYKDVGRTERAAVRRYLGYTMAGTALGLVAMAPFLAMLT